MKKFILISWGIFLSLLVGGTMYSTLYNYSQLPQVRLIIPSLIASNNDKEVNKYNEYDIPLEILQVDNDNRYFVWGVEKKKGPWRREYTCLKQYVISSKKHSNQVTIRGNIHFPIVANANELKLSNKCQVRIRK